MDRHVSERVVEAVSARTRTDPLELPPLYDVLDPDALDALLATLSDGEVSFPYAGYVVTVESSGAVHVDGPLTASDSTGEVASGTTD